MHTDGGPDVDGAEHFDREIRVHLADELCAIARREVGFLVRHIVSRARCSWAILMFILELLVHQETHAVQMGCDIAIGVDYSLVPAQLDDFSDDHDIAAHVRVQVGTGYARSRLHCLRVLRVCDLGLGIRCCRMQIGLGR